MIIGIYATLGLFLLMASRDPDAHKSIIWFTVWSSVVHGAIMAWQAFSDAAERGHLVGDVPALFLSRDCSRGSDGLVRSGDDRCRHRMTHRT